MWNGLQIGDTGLGRLDLLVSSADLLIPRHEVCKEFIDWHGSKKVPGCFVQNAMTGLLQI